MMATTPSSPWADIQPDLLGLVLKRLPSFADRIRLRAVCRPWRSNARLLLLPPPLPWISLPDGTFLSISDDKIHQMPLPDDAYCRGSIDNWLFLGHSDGGFSLINPFSKATLQLPDLTSCCQYEMRDGLNQLLHKLVVPSPLDLSPDSLVAALIKNLHSESVLCICKPPTVTDSFRGKDSQISDVAFLDGKLYALYSSWKILTIDITDGRKPKISSIECVVDEEEEEEEVSGATFQSFPQAHAISCLEYLVESGGRLLRVTRDVVVPRLLPPLEQIITLDNAHTVCFEVFEADLTTGSRMWKRAESLRGQALFVGSHSSKSLPAVECGGHGPQEDCIYFICDYCEPDVVTLFATPGCTT